MQAGTTKKHSRLYRGKVMPPADGALLYKKQISGFESWPPSRLSFSISRRLWPITKSIIQANLVTVTSSKLNKRII